MDFQNLRSYFHRYTQDVEHSLNFLEWLVQTKPPIGKPTVKWEAPLYRIVYGGFDPLSVAGSLSTGGRFNIGGAQMNHFFPNLTMGACLYAATTLACAQKEAGAWGKGKAFQLQPKRALKLWDLEEAMGKLSYPGLKREVDATPLAAVWTLQKVPKVSQILAAFLRQKGGEGLLYPSTKDPSGCILAFFAKDDPHVGRLFDATDKFKSRIERKGN